MGNTVGSFLVNRYTSTDKHKVKDNSRSMKRELKKWKPKSSSHKTSRSTTNTKSRTKRKQYKQTQNRENDSESSESSERSRKRTTKKEKIKKPKRRQKQQLYVNEKDATDPLINSFNVQPRNSSSKRCLEWVQNLPHSSAWDKQHTVSGDDVCSLDDERATCKKPKKKSSQRKLLMKKIIDKKLHKITSRKKNCRRKLSHQDIALLKASARKSKTKVLKRSKSSRSSKSQSLPHKTYSDSTNSIISGEESSLNSSKITVPKKKPRLTKSNSRKVSLTNSKHQDTKEDVTSFDQDSYVAKPTRKKSKAVVPSSKNIKYISNTEESCGSDTICSDRTSVLQEKAQNVVKNVFLNAEKPKSDNRGKEIAAMCFQDVRKRKPRTKHKNESIAYDSESWDSDSPSNKSQSNDSEDSGNSTVIDKSGRRYAVQTECMQSAKQRRHDKKKKKRRKKIKGWLQESCKSRPRTKATTSRIYARKHRAGLYLSQERQKASLGWAILQSIKLLEQKSIPYPLAILHVLHNMWDYTELTLIQLKQALHTMERKGVLKSSTIRDKNKIVTIFRKNDKSCNKGKSTKLKKKPCRKQRNGRGSSTVECGVPIRKQRGEMRVRFQHGSKNYTSVKCKKNGSHYLNYKKSRHSK